MGVKYKAELELKKVRIPDELKHYRDHKEDKIEANAQNAIHNIHKVAERLNLPCNKRNQEEYIFEQGLKFCKKYNININFDVN